MLAGNVRREGIARRVRRIGAGRLLVAMACVALVAALLRPSVPLPRPVYELLLVVDITQSMNTIDQPWAGSQSSRIAAARDALQGLLEAMPCGSRAGLAVFTEYRSLLLLAPVEVCEHYGELRATLARLDWRMGWAGASEVAKGLHFAITLVRELQPKPALVFVSDGHEAPAAEPGYRFDFGDRPGDASGVIVGVGGQALSPIPKFDMEGRSLGYWAAEEVSSPATRAAGRSPGGSAEHLSSLKETHLNDLAQMRGLVYHRLISREELVQAILRPELARNVSTPTALDRALAVVALAALLAILARRISSRT